MSDVIHLCKPALPMPVERDILRYMGVRGEDAGMSELVRECLVLCEDSIDARACFSLFDIGVCEGASSRSLEKHLEGCESVVLFAVTLGLGFDRLISRYSRLEPSRALCLDAIGTERIEAACDAVEGILSDCGYKHMRSRFSAGYGDLSLDFQRNIFALLDCERKIGINLNESLLVSPSKTVTAIVGIEK